MQETERNPYMEFLEALRTRSTEAPDDTTSSTPTTSETLRACGLDNIDCPICGNTGTILYKKDDGATYGKECSCMATRRSLRRIARSNMSDMLSRYTFETYEIPDAERAAIKGKAKSFVKADSGWFFLFGRSGSGKTHICTAICKAFIERGKDTYYMAWRDESRNLKSLINTDEIEKPLNRLKRVPVLYIDDFFKGSCNEADIRLAFEILNARYNDARLRTIISSEFGIRKILELDEALGSRIYERSKGYVIQAPDDNWRLR